MSLHDIRESLEIQLQIERKKPSLLVLELDQLGLLDVSFRTHLNIRNIRITLKERI